MTKSPVWVAFLEEATPDVNRGQRVTPACDLEAFTHPPVKTRPAPHRPGSGPAQPCTVEVEGGMETDTQRPATAPQGVCCKGQTRRPTSLETQGR